MNPMTAAEAEDAPATGWPATELAFREENTRLEPSSKLSASEGFADHALPAGTEIEGFSLVRPIGEGGFGIVYLAWDAALERHVAIKEYMPKQLATRDGATLRVAMRSGRDRGIFDEGLKSFVNEARLLARFNHPALVKVLRFWQANGTAYMAMPYYEGPTLKAALEHAPTPPNEATIRDWLRSLLDALSAIHRENCYHRDISPDNILLTESGPLLLDFGAARRVITDRTQALTTMLKPGFAPIEQYGGVIMQGPWTDLYALAGVVHYAITGRPPVPSVERIVNDMQPLLADAQAGRYDASLLHAIDAGLAVLPAARPQDVQAFRELLNQGLAGDSPLQLSTLKAQPLTPHVEVFSAAETLVEEPPVAPIRAVRPTLPASPAVPAPTQGALLRHRKRWLFGLLALCVIAGTLHWWPGTTVKPSPPKAAPVNTAPAAKLLETAPAPAPVVAPAPVIAPALAEPAPKIHGAPPPGLTRQSAPPARASAAVSRKPVRPPVASANEPTIEAPVQVAPSSSERSRPPMCGDLVLKASLEPLTQDELSLLKSKCR